MEEKNEQTLAWVCHLLGLVGFLGPLIIWLIKKDESPAVDKNGKESLNFQISIAIYTVAAMILSPILAFIIIGLFLMPAVVIFNLVMIIIATIKTSQGEDFQYPLCLRLVK